MGLISLGGENLLDFLEHVLSTYDGDLRPALVASGKSSPHGRCSGAFRDSSTVDVRA